MLSGLGKKDVENDETNCSLVLAVPSPIAFLSVPQLSAGLFVDAQSGLLYVSVDLELPDPWVEMIEHRMHRECCGQKYLGETNDDL
jgi:hypothetical protein